VDELGALVREHGGAEQAGPISASTMTLMKPAVSPISTALPFRRMSNRAVLTLRPTSRAARSVMPTRPNFPDQ
jgi:hypothetical protein